MSTEQKRKGTANSYDKIVGEKLYTLRKLRGKTQEEIADILNVTFQQVQKYEKGTNRISAGNLFILSEALEVDINEFSPYERGSLPLLDKDMKKIVRACSDLQSEQLSIVAQVAKSLKVSGGAHAA